MNVLMLSLMYPEDMKTQVARDAKDKLQNQINSYQRAFVEGIKSNLLPVSYTHLECIRDR